MKSIVIVFLLFVALVAAEDFEECAKETEITEEELALFRKDELKSTDPKTHCFVRCILGKKNFFDAEGLPQKEVIIKHLTEKNPDKNAKEIMTECLKKHSSVGAASCEITYNRYKCAYENGILIL
ncbi:general odorant-binding protein 56d-like [Phlebotomus argentipes]|uniref:general odorant-binding protein 56d-like n=1 Tax=Phlebotomus argentipes TaxID=94469 RepID=UPI0028936510|nr:general odorant-binding protein 56d-like [Phlebotomus argentipes]